MKKKEMEYLIKYITASIVGDFERYALDGTEYWMGYLDAKMNMLALIKVLLHEDFETFEDYGKFLLMHCDEMQKDIDELKASLLMDAEEVLRS